VHELTAREARRVAVHAQLLDRPRPTDLDAILHHLTLVQLDPTNAVAPSADLVLWSRLGEAYDPRDLQDARDELRVLELDSMIRPAADIALFRDEMERWPVHDWQQSAADWVEDNEPFRLDVLELLRAEGPLTAPEIPDTAVRPWRSSGWNNKRNVQMLLDHLVRRGEVAVAGTRGRHKLWDLAERIHADVPALPYEEALRARDRRRLASLGLVREKARATPVEPAGVGAAGEPARVEGVRGTWRVDPAALAAVRDGFAGRVALLSPFDRLLADRARVADLFAFEYVLEMYKPAAQRRWGYYALPVLRGDTLIGKLDARAERDAGVLRVHAVHEDGDWSAAARREVWAEIDALAAWLGLRVAPDAGVRRP